MDNRADFRKKIIIIISIIAVICALGAVLIVILIMNTRKDKYYESVDLASTYISSLRYDEAIAEYERALEIDDSDPEIYQKLSVLYEETGNLNQAKAIAIKGYQTTGSVVLSDIVQHINSFGTTGYEFKENSELIVADISGKKSETTYMSVKGALMAMLQNYAYSDFTSEYGQCQLYIDNGFVVADFDGITVYFPESTADINNMQDYKGKAYAMSYDDVSDAFDGYSGSDGLTYPNMVALFGSSLLIKYDDKLSRYYVETDYEGFNIKIETDKDGNVVKKYPWNMFTVLDYNDENLSNATDATTQVSAGDDQDSDSIFLGSISGTVKDATTGGAANGVKMIFRKGSGMRSGASVLEYTTDITGTYKVELDEGNYCVQLSKQGYIDSFEDVTIMRNVDRTGIDFVISTEVNGEIRIVLEWESQPEDLDAHLTGRTDSGSSVNVSFQNKESYDSNGNCLAELDVDDRNGNGPETITIHEVNGRYEFFVVDYTQTGTMANTNVKVTIYLPDNSSETRTINGGLGSTDLWEVCTIDHGQISFH